MNDRFPWHEENWKRVQASEAHARLPHALLLRGPGGVGKRQFARRLARTLLCRAPSGDGACGKCRACHLAASELHPDLHSVEVPEGRKLIGIEQIREVNERLALTASGGGRKVVVMAPAESMTRPAANTLLKTLEEPPGDTVFILVSDRSSLLPATIRSRCQTLSFPCPPTPVALQWLEGQIDSEASAPDLLQLAQGAPIRAALLAGRNDARAELLRDLESILDGSANPIALAERWVEYGVETVSWWLTTIAQDSIRALSAPDLADANGDILRVARKTPAVHWFRLLDSCLSTRDALARQVNLNERLALESLVLACHGAACDDSPFA